MLRRPNPARSTPFFPQPSTALAEKRHFHFKNPPPSTTFSKSSGQKARSPQERR
jgi:hypothetical protein